MERPINVSRISAADIGVYEGIGRDPKPAAVAAPTASVGRRAVDRVTLSPEAKQHQAIAHLTTSPLDATESEIAAVLERSYQQLYERAGKGEYLASIADTSDRSADATAGRILGGITGYIYGAYRMANPEMTSEQFDTFQTQVLRGFNRGMSEARQMIGEAGLLDSTTTQDIGMTEELVRSGLDDFFASEKERLFGEPEPEQAA
jgi:hypothetical protein